MSSDNIENKDTDQMRQGQPNVLPITQGMAFPATQGFAPKASPSKSLVRHAGVYNSLNAAETGLVNHRQFLLVPPKS